MASSDPVRLVDADGNAITSSNPNPVSGQIEVGGSLPAGDNNIGNVDVVSVLMPGTIRNGKKTVTTAGTREPLVASSAPLLSGVIVKALIGNSGTVYVGDAAVGSGNGFELSAGQEIFIVVNNLNKIYIDVSAGASGQGVTFVGS